METLDIPKETLKSIYEMMLRIRIVEERIVELYPEQEMRCPVHLCIGQEAVPAAVCANLTRNDYTLSTHRSHGHYLAKGGFLSDVYYKSTDYKYHLSVY
jgi:TPP-dependent pyruvate/acetoin dehydrogenase alpha subunit